MPDPLALLRMTPPSTQSITCGSALSIAVAGRKVESSEPPDRRTAVSLLKSSLRRGCCPARDGHVLAADRSTDPARPAEPVGDRAVRWDVYVLAVVDAGGAHDVRGWHCARARRGVRDRAGDVLYRNAGLVCQPHRTVAADGGARGMGRRRHDHRPRPRLPRPRQLGKRARPTSRPRDRASASGCGRTCSDAVSRPGKVPGYVRFAR